MGRVEIAAVKRRLAELGARFPHAAAAVAAAVEKLAGTPGDPASFTQLDDLLEAQAYRVCFWRVASDEINYRRFFDVNELAGLRMELPDVFEHAHKLIFRLLAEGVLDGLRIDHVDGLLNPKEYFQRLRSAPGARPPGEPFYLVVEKILAYHENLREDWPVDGTTGYEFLNMVNGLFVDGTNARGLDEVYQRFIGERLSFDDLIYAKKQLIMRASMAS